MKTNKIPSKLQDWIDARKRYRLSDVHVQMARELGLNPKKLDKIDNYKQESLELFLPSFIETLYVKKFSKSLTCSKALFGGVSRPSVKTCNIIPQQFK